MEPEKKKINEHIDDLRAMLQNIKNEDRANCEEFINRLMLDWERQPSRKLTECCFYWTNNNKLKCADYRDNDHFVTINCSNYTIQIWWTEGGLLARHKFTNKQEFYAWCEKVGIAADDEEEED